MQQADMSMSLVSRIAFVEVLILLTLPVLVGDTQLVI